MWKEKHIWVGVKKVGSGRRKSGSQPRIRQFAFYCIYPHLWMHSVFGSDHFRRARHCSPGDIFGIQPHPPPPPMGTFSSSQKGRSRIEIKFSSYFFQLLFLFSLIFFLFAIFHSLRTSNLPSPSSNFLLHFGVRQTQSIAVFNYSVVINFVII